MVVFSDRNATCGLKQWQVLHSILSPVKNTQTVSTTAVAVSLFFNLYCTSLNSQHSVFGNLFMKQPMLSLSE